MPVAGIMFLALVVAVSNAVAEEPAPPTPPPKSEAAKKPKKELSAEDKARIQKLIEDLGAKEWVTREAASAELIKFGRPALSFLREAAKSKDPEVAHRAREALEKLGADSQARSRSKSCLRQIGLACHIWSDDNDEIFPPDLLKLVPTYLDNKDLLQCPAYSKHAEDGLDYAYVSGLRPTDSGDTVLAYETLPGPDGKVNVLYADAHVAAVKLDELKKTLEAQAAAKAKDKREIKRLEPKGVECEEEDDE